MEFFYVFPIFSFHSDNALAVIDVLPDIYGKGSQALWVVPRSSQVLMTDANGHMSWVSINEIESRRDKPLIMRKRKLIMRPV